MRTLVRSLIAALLAAAPLLAGLASPATAQVSNSFSRTDQASSRSLTVSITSVSPDWAQSSSTITVKGTITNDTGSPVSGIQVSLLTWADQPGLAPFSTRSAMESFVSSGGGAAYYQSETMGTYALPRTLHTNVTMSWSVSFSASAAGYQEFGVYPIQAFAYDPAQYPLATDQTLLPYWPGRGSADKLNISWVWPVIDEPQQGACADTLATNSLAQSFSGSGRLNTLLDVGLKHQGDADLTWMVDPALLSDASVMTKPYSVGGNAECGGATSVNGNSAAKSWLTKFSEGAPGDSTYVTPYADVDVSALAHAGLDSDLQNAYKMGQTTAKSVLSQYGDTSDGQPSDSITWPAGGTADYTVVTALANNTNVSGILLSSSELPNATSDVARVPTGIGTQMTALLADSELSSLLGSAPAGSSAGSQFAVEQDFLAETAMIVAESPFTAGRSLIVAPPQRWDPSAAEANSLLSTTTSVPWLNPVSLSSVAQGKADPQQLASNQVSSSELSRGYLSTVESVDSSLSLYKNLLYQPSDGAVQPLEAAVAAAESSAWRGGGRDSGLSALSKLSGFLRSAEHKVQIIVDKKMLLTGNTGDIPVSVRNGLSVPVEVEVQALLPTGGALSVKRLSPIIVRGQQTETKGMEVSSSAISTTTMQLQLVTRDGSPLTWTTQSLNVQATRYGRALLILIAAALGVLVLTSVARWVRQWLNDTRAGSGGTG